MYTDTIIQQVQLELREGTDMFRTSKRAKKCSFSLTKYVTGLILRPHICDSLPGRNSRCTCLFFVYGNISQLLPKKKDEFTD